MGLAQTAPVTAARVRDGEPAALGALVDRRGSAVLAYCEEVAEPGKARAAAGEAFACFRREVVAADEPRALDPEAVLLRGTRQAAAKAAARTVSPRAGLARRLGTTCVLVPELLAARAEGSLTAADKLRLSRHLERCGACREAEERFAAGERAYHEAPSTPPPSEVADQMLAALRDAAPTVEPGAEPAPAEPGAAVVAEGNGSPRPVIDHGETLSWDAADVAAAAAGASERRGVWRIALRFALPLVVFVAAFVIALAVAGVFSDNGNDPAGSIETQSDEPPSAIRVHARPVTTPLPSGVTGAVQTAPRSETASATVDNTVVVTSRHAAVAPSAPEPEPQLRAQARSRSEAAAPPPEQSAPATTDPGFQPATQPAAP